MHDNVFDRSCSYFKSSYKAICVLTIAVAATQLVSCQDNPPSSSESHQLSYVGDTVNNGTFEFQIESVEVVQELTSTFSRLRPADDAVYIVVVWNFRNVSAEPVSASDQPRLKLLDGAEVEYAADVEASSTAALATGISRKYVSNINPNIRVRDVDVFEVSKSLFSLSDWRILVRSDGKHLIAMTSETVVAVLDPAVTADGPEEIDDYSNYCSGYWTSTYDDENAVSPFSVLINPDRTFEFRSNSGDAFNGEYDWPNREAAVYFSDIADFTYTLFDCDKERGVAFLKTDFGRETLDFVMTQTRSHIEEKRPASTPTLTPEEDEPAPSLQGLEAIADGLRAEGYEVTPHNEDNIE